MGDSTGFSAELDSDCVEIISIAFDTHAPKATVLRIMCLTSYLTLPTATVARLSSTETQTPELRSD